MKFGKTEAERRKEYKRKYHVWCPVFAFLPVRLRDGRWAWLEYVERISWWDNQISAFEPCSLFGWAYRELKK